jgi:hypothetical protein
MTAKMKKILKGFREGVLPYYDIPSGVKTHMQADFATALTELQDAVRIGVGFEGLKTLSEKLRIPLSELSRPSHQILRKTLVAGPFEIWWKMPTYYSKIGIGNTLSEAFEEAKKNIISTTL